MSHDHHHGHAHDHHHDHAHHDHAHGGAHDHAHGSSEGRLLIALAVSVLFMLLEVAAGIYSSSLALIADAGHMLTDAVSLVLAYVAIRVARRPADAARSYGYDRLQVLSAFINGLSLLAISAWIIIEAVQRTLSPLPIDGHTMLWVSALGVLVNLTAFAILHGGAAENLNMRAAVAHVLSDLAASAATVLAALVILYTGWVAADPLLSALVAALILRTGWLLTRTTGHVLLEGAPENLDVAQLAVHLVKEVPGVTDVHHVHVWMLTPEKTMLTLHARLAADADADETTRKICAWLKEKHGIAHATVQIERAECAEPHH